MLVRVEPGVHFLELPLERRLNGLSGVRFGAATARLRRKQNERERAWISGSHEAARFHVGMLGKPALNRRRGDVFTFGSFELLLRATDDADLTVAVHGHDVACMEESGPIETLPAGFGILVIPNHVHRATDQQLTFDRNALLDAADGWADIAGPHGDRIRQ